MPLQLEVNATELKGMAEAWQLAPAKLLTNLAIAYGKIGRGDIDELRAGFNGSGLRMGKSAQAAFRFKSTDPAKATDGSKIFVSEYSKWKASSIHETGGTITGKRGNLWILQEAARGVSGKRRWTDAQIKANIASGKFKLIPVGAVNKFRMAVVQMIGKHKFKTIAFLTKAVTLKSRFNLKQLMIGNMPQHVTYIQEAIDETIAETLAGHGV